MAQNQISAGRRFVTGVAVAGGAAVVAVGMSLAGAGTAAADNQQNVVKSGNKVSPKSTSVSAQNSADNNIISRIGTVISNAQTQLGTAGTNAISQTGTAIQNGQIQVGTAGNNAISQLGSAGNGLLKGIGNLFNRG